MSEIKYLKSVLSSTIRATGKSFFGGLFKSTLALDLSNSKDVATSSTVLEDVTIDINNCCQWNRT